MNKLAKMYKSNLFWNPEFNKNFTTTRKVLNEEKKEKKNPC